MASYDELNSWLLDRCIAYAKAHKHPELTDQTIWRVFAAERSHLLPIAGRFGGFHATTEAVSKTCLVRFDNNKYSVPSRAVGRPVEIQAYADRIRFTTPGIMCRYWRASPAPCATVHRSRTGCCHQTLSVCGVNWAAQMMATGRW